MRQARDTATAIDAAKPGLALRPSAHNAPMTARTHVLLHGRCGACRALTPNAELKGPGSEAAWSPQARVFSAPKEQWRWQRRRKDIRRSDSPVTRDLGERLRDGTSGDEELPIWYDEDEDGDRVVQHLLAILREGIGVWVASAWP